MCVSVCLVVGDIVQSHLSHLSKEIGTILCEASAQLILMAFPASPLAPTRSGVLCSLNYTRTHATKTNKTGEKKKSQIEKMNLSRFVLGAVTIRQICPQLENSVVGCWWVLLLLLLGPV